MPQAIPYTAKKIAQIRSWVKDCATWLEARDVIADKLGIHPDNATKMNRRHVFWEQPMETLTGQGPKINIATTAHGDAFDVEVETSKAATLDEVVGLCKVDTELWVNKGFTVRRGAKGYAWSARFEKRKDPGLEVALATFAERAANHAPRKWVVEKRVTKGADCLYVLNLQDLHLGKLAHGKETGHADWDIRIAEAAYRAAVEDLMNKAPAARIEEVVFVVGSDMLQIDNDQSQTSKGTFVDSDSRLPKVFDVASKVLTDVIELVASRFKVRAVVVAGNHDGTTSHFLGRYVQAWFRSHPNVTVDADPCSRKYVPYGKTLVAFDHGDETPLKELPLTVMRENQSTISQFRFTECLTGHRHHEGAEDMKGVVVRVAPALCSPDKWHARKGYIGSIRRSQGLLYQRENGLEAIYYSTPLD